MSDRGGSRLVPAQRAGRVLLIAAACPSRLPRCQRPGHIASAALSKRSAACSLLICKVMRSLARDANNVLRSFRSIVAKSRLGAEDWTPREMRHSFVSLLSDSGVAIEDIAQLVGHKGGSEVTETVYRKQLRPVLLQGAEAMDRIFVTQPIEN